MTGVLLLERLTELLFVLDQYALFGAEGVEAAVQNLIGSIALWNFSGVFISPDLSSKIKKSLGIAKAALGVLVYSKSGVEALDWAANAYVVLLPSP